MSVKSQQLRERLASIKADIARLKLEGEELANLPEITPGQDQRLSDVVRAVEKKTEEYDRLHLEWEAEARRMIDAGEATLIPGSADRRDDDRQSPTFWRRSDPWAEPVGSLSARSADDLRAQALTACERMVASDTRREHVSEIVEREHKRNAADASKLHAWLVCGSDPHYLRAIGKVIADPTRGHMLWTEREREAVQRTDQLVRGMLTKTDGSGGYLHAPVALDPALRLENTGALNPLGVLANNVTMVGTDVYRIPITTGTTATFAAENATVGDNSPSVTISDIEAHRAHAFIEWTIELGMDVDALTNQLERLMRRLRAARGQQADDRQRDERTVRPAHPTPGHDREPGGGGQPPACSGWWTSSRSARRSVPAGAPVAPTGWHR